MSIDGPDGGIVIYTGDNGQPNIEVTFRDETVWLTIEQMAELFDKAKSTVNEHVLNIYKEGELQETDTMKKIGNTDFSTKPTNYYNLDVVISVGYRVKSIQGTRFRQWATQRLCEYITQGFVMNDEFLKNNGGGAYWRKLLARIRDIRSSEKILYRQILDLYATSTDYNPKALHSVKFFKIVQNKLHYAVHKQTAAEVIHSRADSGKEFMGLTVFAGDLPVLEEVRIAKNYLSLEEHEKLNRLVSAYFELAELRALNCQGMTMTDHITALDKLMADYGEGVLQGTGSVSHEQAMKKAEQEYKKYQTRTLSSVEKDYLDTLKSTQKKLEKKK
jgi:hypothetical protein